MSTPKSVADLKIKIFADGADLNDMLEMYARPHISGFTTNPTLMRKAKIRDYKDFALSVIKAIPDRPISFEVFADEFGEMEGDTYQVHDLLSDARYTWHGRRNYIELDPEIQPAHIFRIRRPTGDGRFV